MSQFNPEKRIKIEHPNLKKLARNVMPSNTIEKLFQNKDNKKNNLNLLCKAIEKFHPELKDKRYSITASDYITGAGYTKFWIVHK